jgi:5-methylcytosine-specific restriction endonuclease McrA
MSKTQVPWDEISWKVWLNWIEEFEAKCPYCGLDGTVIENWRQMDTEHIIPSGDWNELNLTVACHACNKTKSNWNPDTKERGFDPSLNKIPNSEENRKDLIDLAREYIQEKWKQNLYTEEIFERQMREGGIKKERD